MKDLVRLVEPFGVGGSTLRAALSRMVTAGDLRRAGSVYGLSDRLLERRRRQDDAVHPATLPWNGDWEMAVVTATGRSPAERAELRTELTRLRLAELREGVWLRPATLSRPWPAELDPVTRHFTALPDTSAGNRRRFCGRWRSGPPGAGPCSRTSSGPTGPPTASPPSRTSCATSSPTPSCPPELLSAHWPGAALRAAYAGFQREVTARTRERA